MTIKLHITKKEEEILKLMAKGLTNKEMADFLLISPNTSTSHVKSIMKKLNVKKRTVLALVALKLNLISIDDIDLNQLLKHPGK